MADHGGGRELGGWTGTTVGVRFLFSSVYVLGFFDPCDYITFSKITHKWKQHLQLITKFKDM